MTDRHPRRPLAPQEQRVSTETLRAGLALTGLDADDLWTASIGLDRATPDPGTLDAVLAAEPGVVLTAHQHDVLAQALNDHLLSRGQDHPVRYSVEFDDHSRT